MKSAGQLLDLNRHGREDIPGTTILIRDTPYTIVDLVESVEKADVYRLRNQRTNIVQFVLVVYRCTPGSSEWRETLEKPAQTFDAACLMSDGDPNDNFVLPLQVYEQNGGVLGLKINYKGGPDPGFHKAEFEVARTLMAQNLNREALLALDRVLDRNANHTFALCDKGVCLGRLGRIEEALKLFFRCMRLEPNESTAFRNAGRFLAAAGRPQAGVLVLKEFLDGHPADFPAWLELVKLASDYDCTDAVEDHIQRGLARLEGRRVSQKLMTWIAESRGRSERYRAAMRSASVAMRGGHWGDALQALDLAVDVSKGNAIAELNRGICFFHQRRFKESVEILRTVIYRVDGNPAWAGGVLLLIGWAHLGEWEVVRFIALDFQGRFPSATDLPRIPIEAKEEYCLEELNVEKIVSVLSQIPSKVKCSPAEVTAIQLLRGRYEKLARTELPSIDPNRLRNLTG